MSILIILLYLSIFMTTGVMVSRRSSLRHLLGYRVILLFMSAHCLVALFSLCVYIVQDFDLKILFSQFRFLGFALFGPCTILFINSLYRRWKWLEHPFWARLLFAPAIVTWVLVLIPHFRHLVLNNFSPIEVYGFSVVTFQAGPWFWVHLIASYLCTLSALILSISIWKSGTKTQRRQIMVILLGCTFSSFVDLYCVLTNSPWRWVMLSGSTFALANIAVIYASLRYQLFEIIPYAIERVFHALADPVLVVNTKNQLEIANHSALNSLQFGQSDYGKYLDELVPYDLTEDSHLSLDGKYFDVLREKLIDQNGPMRGEIIFLREVTYRQKREDSLNAHLSFKSNILSLIAHDALGNIKAQAAVANALNHSQSALESKELANLLIDSNLSIQDFFKNILNWEKSQWQNFTPQMRDFDFRQLIQSCIGTMELHLKLKEIEFEQEWNRDHDLTIRGDEAMLAAVLRNLLSNAMRASKKGGVIRLKVNKTQERLEFSLRDFGCGIEQELLEEMKKSPARDFVQGQSTNGGFGIGLLIVRNFIELHQGLLEIESIRGEGTLVSFSIPLNIPGA